MIYKNCHNLLDDLSDFLDDGASEEVCAEIERHLSDCENCRVMVDTFRQTIYLYRELPKQALPSDIRERLYQKLDLNYQLSTGDMERPIPFDKLP